MLEQQYLQLLRKLYNKATSDKPVLNDNRTGIKTIALANQTLTHDLSNSELPLLYSKKVLVNAIIHELIWMLSGSTNIKYLKDNKINIWNNWSRPDGDLGKVYGYQMRNWNVLKLLDKNKGYTYETDYEKYDIIDSSTFKDKVLIRHTVDQIKKIEWQLKNNPNDRRIVLNLWNVTDLDEMSLQPCFLKDTIVKTKDKYKFIQDVEDSDLLYSHDGTYNKINEIFKTVYEKDVYKIKTFFNSVPINTTEEHPFLTQDGFKKAKDLSIDDYFCITINDKSEVYTHKFKKPIKNQYCEKYVDEEFKLNLNDYYCMGYFLGNGWVLNKTDTFQFAIPNTKLDYIFNKLRKSLKISKIKNSGINCTKVKGANVKWASLFRKFSHLAHNKIIPDFIENSPKEFIESFLEGYIDSDGYKLKDSNCFSFTTTSKDIAYGLQRLYLKLGTISRVYYQKRPETTIIEGRTVNQRNTYSVTTIKGDKNNNFFFKDNMCFIKIQNIEKENLGQVEVYNFEVDNTNTYTVNNLNTHNCHFATVFTVIDGKLNSHLTMRSADLFLGVPFNVVFYSILTILLAKLNGLELGEFAVTMVNCHIYENHLDAIKTQLERVGDNEHLNDEWWCTSNLLDKVALPTLEFEIKNSVLDYKFEDLKVNNYKHMSFIKAPVAV